MNSCYARGYGADRRLDPRPSNLEFRGMLVLDYILDYVWNQFFKYDKAARRRDGAASPS
jgi:hypothetical protein